LILGAYEKWRRKMPKTLNQMYEYYDPYTGETYEVRVPVSVVSIKSSAQKFSDQLTDDFVVVYEAGEKVVSNVEEYERRVGQISSMSVREEGGKIISEGSVPIGYAEDEVFKEEFTKNLPAKYKKVVDEAAGLDRRLSEPLVAEIPIATSGKVNLLIEFSARSSYSQQYRIVFRVITTRKDYSFLGKAAGKHMIPRKIWGQEKDEMVDSSLVLIESIMEQWWTEETIDPSFDLTQEVKSGGMSGVVKMQNGDLFFIPKDASMYDRRREYFKDVLEKGKKVPNKLILIDSERELLIQTNSKGELDYKYFKGVLPLTNEDLNSILNKKLWDVIASRGHPGSAFHRWDLSGRIIRNMMKIDPTKRPSDIPPPPSSKEEKNVFRLFKGSYGDWLNVNGDRSLVEIHEDGQLLPFIKYLKKVAEDNKEDVQVYTYLKFMGIVMAVLLNVKDHAKIAHYVKERRRKFDAATKENLPAIPSLRSDLFYFAHQAEACAKLGVSGETAILDVSTGGGKTLALLTDILVLLSTNKIEHSKGERPIIVVPNALVGQWIGEINFFTEGKINPIAVTTETWDNWGEEPLKKLCHESPPNSVFITTYSFLTNKSSVDAFDDYVFPNVDWLLDNIKIEYVALDECFFGSTHVMVDYDKAVTMEEVYNNDSITHVLSYDLEEKKTVKKRILKRLRTPIRETDEFITTHIYDKERGIHAKQYSTTGHSIFLKDGSEKKAEDLETGDSLITYDGNFQNHYVEVTGHGDVGGSCSRMRNSEQWKYDLTIEDSHNYFVLFGPQKGNDRYAKPKSEKFVPVLVHNSHLIKNPESERSQACIRLRRAKYRRLSTGTLITNRPSDLVGQIAFLDPRAIGGSKEEFAARYATHVDNYGNPVVWKPNAKEMIRNDLKNNSFYMVYREKDWAAALPEIEYRTHVTQMAPEHKAVYKQLVEDVIDEIMADPKLAAKWLEFIQGQEEGESLKFSPLLGKLAKLEQYLTAPDHNKFIDYKLETEEKISVKLPKIDELIKKSLEAGHKCIVGVHYKWSARHLHNYSKYKDQGIYYDASHKDNLVKFINDDRVKVMFAVVQCFEGDTRVMVDYNKAMKISDIYENDSITHVLSYDLEAKKIVRQKIRSRSRTDAREDVFYNLSIAKPDAEGRHTVNVTGNHHIWSHSRKKYVKVRELEVGEKVVTYNGDFEYYTTCELCGEQVKSDRQSWADHWGEHKTGLSYEEWYGSHKAKRIKEKISSSLKITGVNNPLKGLTHKEFYGVEKAEEGIKALNIDSHETVTNMGMDEVKAKLEAFTNNHISEVVDVRKSCVKLDYKYNLDVADTHNYFVVGVKERSNDPENGIPFLVSNSITEGLNLQMADRIIMADYDWTPGKTKQLIARIFRPYVDKRTGKNMNEGRKVWIETVLSDNSADCLKYCYQTYKKILNAGIMEECPIDEPSSPIIEKDSLYASFNTIGGETYLSKDTSYNNWMISEIETARKSGDHTPVKPKSARSLPGGKMDIPWVIGMPLPEDAGGTPLLEWMEEKNLDTSSMSANREHLVNKIVRTEFGEGKIVGAYTRAVRIKSPEGEAYSIDSSKVILLDKTKLDSKKALKQQDQKLMAPDKVVNLFALLYNNIPTLAVDLDDPDAKILKDHGFSYQGEYYYYQIPNRKMGLTVLNKITKKYTIPPGLIEAIQNMINQMKRSKYEYEIPENIRLFTRLKHRKSKSGILKLYPLVEDGYLNLVYDKNTHPGINLTSLGFAVEDGYWYYYAQTKSQLKAMINRIRVQMKLEIENFDQLKEDCKYYGISI
jgi:hypothetical protein